MPRIAGVNIPEDKPIFIALTYIKGIGRTLSYEILRKAGVSFHKRAKDLTPQEVSKIQEVIDKEGYLVGGELIRTVRTNIKRLIDLGCWRGLRHKAGLPVRGQNTRINSRTVRRLMRGVSRRITVGSGRKKAPAPK